jgi:hypothetical protein
VSSVCRAIAPSIFLRPFAPPELPGFDATMDALTPARRPAALRPGSGLPGQVSLLHESVRPDVPTPTTPCRPGHHELVFSDPDFNHEPRTSCRDRSLRDSYGTSASPDIRRLAATKGRIEFTFVSDRPFAFRCSPPRLATTQFQSATGPSFNLLTGTFTPLNRFTHKRTNMSPFGDMSLQPAGSRNHSTCPFKSASPPRQPALHQP